MTTHTHTTCVGVGRRAESRAVGPSHPQVKFKVTQPWSSKLTSHNQTWPRRLLVHGGGVVEVHSIGGDSGSNGGLVLLLMALHW